LKTLLISTADSLSVADEKFPPKFNYQNHNRRLEKNVNGRNSRSDSNDDFYSKSNIDEDSLEQSKILEFIKIIRTNATERNYYCKPNEQSIDLSNFTYKFPRASYQRYKKQTRDGLFIAKYLTHLFTHNRTNIQSFSDKHAPAIISVIRLIVEEDKNLAGGGIALSNNFFPYIFKSEDGIKQEDLGLVYKNYRNEIFFSTHNHSGSSDVVSGTDVSISSDDAYFGQPYFDCFKHKRWIAAISLPFYGYGMTGNTVKFM
jgi:hypothetical protein